MREGREKRGRREGREERKEETGGREREGEGVMEEGATPDSLHCAVLHSPVEVVGNAS